MTLTAAWEQGSANESTGVLTHCWAGRKHCAHSLGGAGVSTSQTPLPSV